MNKTVAVFLGFLGVVAVAAIALSLHWRPGAVSQAADDSRIRNYIIGHPEVLLESVARFQAARQGSPDASTSALIAAGPRYDRPDAGLKPVPEALVAQTWLEVAGTGRSGAR